MANFSNAVINLIVINMCIYCRRAREKRKKRLQDEDSSAPEILFDDSRRLASGESHVVRNIKLSPSRSMSGAGAPVSTVGANLNIWDAMLYRNSGQQKASVNSTYQHCSRWRHWLTVLPWDTSQFLMLTESNYPCEFAA